MLAKSNHEIDSLVSKIQAISQDIGMDFGVKKCGVTIMHQGKLVKSEDIRLTNRESIEEVVDDTLILGA